MLSIDSLLEQERAIPDKWNSEIQDNARLRIISELSAQSAFTEAENILYKLNFSDSKKEAEDIIANFRKDPWNLKIENYIKYAEVQMKTYLPESDGIKKRKNLSDLERYKEALKYIEDHINMMTISRNYQIKRKIGKINDEEMKIYKYDEKMCL